MSPFNTISHSTEVCVVGGGMTGVCAAIAAARSGAQVVLAHDRPVLGGNASEEIRMWICGAFGSNMRETGIIEEIELENIYRNPQKNYSQWTAVLHDFVTRERGITLLLNCSILDEEARKEGTDALLESVRGWQLTTQQFHEIAAPMFIDCSGDSILAPICGAETRWGRESRDEFGESHAPVGADRRTMGMSCLIQLRETEEPQEFLPPWFAKRIEREDIGPGRGLNPQHTNYWWMETGGEGDAIAGTEEFRDDLLSISSGVADSLKRNEPELAHGHWTLEWMGFLPGKRESRRYVGDHIITQTDVEAGGTFEDIVAYGGWSMDDHAPAGFYYPGEPTTFHPSPSPWGIPYRALYSRNVANVLCAGRNISATHIALSSSRVMRTCAGLGQAAGTAAAIAVRHGTSPRGIYESHLAELQQSLMDQDVYLPGRARATGAHAAGTPSRTGESTADAQGAVPRASIEASNAGRTYDVSLARTVYPPDAPVFSSGLKCGQRTRTEWYRTTATADPTVLVNGVDRTVGDTDNGYWCAPGDTVTWRLAWPTRLVRARLVFDSNLSRYYRDHRMKCNYPLNDPPTRVAESLVKRFVIETERDGVWESVHEADSSHQRLVTVRLPEKPVSAVRFTPLETWGSDLVHLFAFEVTGADG